MRVPPVVLKVWVNADNGKRVRIWLPLFLIWPLVLILGLVLFPFVLLCGIILMVLGRKEGMLLVVAGPMLAKLLCASRGLRVDVSQGSNTVYVELK